ncbi:alpha-(1-_3)-arabinofuranosyltransferase domain-containing protein [Paractinoplanes rishiriensis]|uniref:F5/8 type C domain-containing protein n=1 Tax=Paractinoplanes rishiriensis TaxID=1050105 RepID=A0A919JVK8_9ACTN|nr:alpha-(1->3)-arabinofuranosyltransferase family protein [Actinoplanes rishiriensis]GIE94364.1 hypothetical protein Ari01nite_18290 [Actinoplanes rishiriensis]
MTGTVVWRLRVATGCVLLTALSFLQQPGRIAADTKVDLVVSPLAWLGRALHAWDPAGNFGQMQNQAYGYLFPMGPFFALGDLLGMPAWVVQRLWWALLLCVAFTGVVVLAGRLGIGTPAARLIGGVAFALSPRILSELGPVSVEAWPSAVAPWVLVPLVTRAPGWRALALSGLAVAAAGGVNATAVLAVLPLAVLWLRRLTLVIGWGIAVALATAWWVAPLLLLGRFSPPFLDYIETAGTTTRPTDAVSTLRGASHWLAYLSGVYGPGWPAGWQLATGTTFVLATVAVAGFGIAGLCRRGMPHRRFLITGVLAGVAIVGLGHLGQINGLFAWPLHQWLDGAGAPLRNLHKFDVVLRLPLTLGFIHFAATAFRAVAMSGRWHRGAPAGAAGGWQGASPAGAAGWQRGSAAGPGGWQRGALAGAAALAAVAVAAGPALTGGLVGNGSFLNVPGYWRNAAAWLDAHAGTGRILVVPGARFPSYLWGAPGDEMVQPLLRSAWAVRNSIPLVPPTTVRMLDTVETALAAGRGSTGLASLLARSGVRYLLVRADLDTGRSGAARQLAVRSALESSPGFTPVARFGPAVGGQPADSFLDNGLDVPVPALEVFAVTPAASGGAPGAARAAVPGASGAARAGASGAARAGASGAARAGASGAARAAVPGAARAVAPVAAFDVADARTVVGGPESLLALADAGQLGPGPAVLAGDLPAGVTTGGTVLTDGLRRREVTFGQARDNASATLTAEQPYRLRQPAHDYGPAWASGRETVTRFLGVRDVTASSSYAQALPLTGNRTEHHPFAALDGDPGTSWRSAPGTAGIGQWLEVAFERPRTVRQVRLTVDRGADAIPTRVTVQAGHERQSADLTGESVTVSLDGLLAVDRVRVTVDQVWSVRLGYGGVGISELAVPGLKAHRTLVLPGPRPATGGLTPVAAVTGPSTVVAAAAPSTPACYFLASRPYCSSEAGRASEDGGVLDRTIPGATGDYDLRLWARPRAGPQLSTAIDNALAGLNTPRVTASSVGLSEPAARPGAALDGDLDTAWYAADEDRNPWLRLDWSSSQILTGIRVGLGPRTAASRPWSVTVLTDSGPRTGTLDRTGLLKFEPRVHTNDITVLFTGGTAAFSFAPYSARTERLPMAVGTLAVLPDNATVDGDRDTVVRLPCGSGPSVSSGDRVIKTAFTATVDDLLQRRELPMRLCGPDAPLSLSGSRVVATASRYAEPTRLTLLPPNAGPPSATPIDTVQSIDRWSPTSREITLDHWPNQRILLVRENTNPGWEARLAGQRLEPLVVDGWQQGWIVPAGVSGPVQIVFAPDRLYRTGLIVGGVLALGLVLTVLLIPASPLSRPLERRSGRRSVLLLVIGAVALVGVGGYAATGLMAAGLALLVAVNLAGRGGTPGVRRGFLRVEWWAASTAFAVAGLLSVRANEPHVAAAPQLAALAALTLLWLSLWRGPAAGGRGTAVASPADTSSATPGSAPPPR